MSERASTDALAGDQPMPQQQGNNGPSQDWLANPSLHSSLILAYLIHSAHVETAACLMNSGIHSSSLVAPTKDLDASATANDACAYNTSSTMTGTPIGSPMLVEQDPSRQSDAPRGGLVGSESVSPPLPPTLPSHALYAPMASSIQPRRHIIQLILSGDAHGALQALTTHFPSSLAIPLSTTSANPLAKEALFALQCQRFIELVRAGGSASEALAFADSELGKFIQPSMPSATSSPRSNLIADASSSKFMQSLSDLVSLIAYTDPFTSPVAHYLSQEQRERTATIINSFILSHLGPYPAMSSLEMLVRQLTVISQELSPAGGSGNKTTASSSSPVSRGSAPSLLANSTFVPNQDVTMAESAASSSPPIDPSTSEAFISPSFAELTDRLSSSHWSLDKFV